MSLLLSYFCNFAVSFIRCGGAFTVGGALNTNSIRFYAFCVCVSDVCVQWHGVAFSLCQIRIRRARVSFNMKLHLRRSDGSRNNVIWSHQTGRADFQLFFSMAIQVNPESWMQTEKEMIHVTIFDKCPFFDLGLFDHSFTLQSKTNVDADSVCMYILTYCEWSNWRLASIPFLSYMLQYKCSKSDTGPRCIEKRQKQCHPPPLRGKKKRN